MDIDWQEKWDKAKYNAKYTAATYLDGAMSLPIGGAKTISWASETLADKLLGKEIPEFLSWDEIEENSPVYEGRETLRDKLDTEPGVKFLQSNLVATGIYFAAGPFVAEGLQDIIRDYMSGSSPLFQNIVNSGTTFISQLAVAYPGFLADEVMRTNTQKYTGEDGKIKPGKVLEGLKNSVRTFAKIDGTIFGMKIGGMTHLLNEGYSAGAASALFDTAVGVPFYWTMVMSYGLNNDLIETEETSERRSSDRKSG